MSQNSLFRIYLHFLCLVLVAVFFIPNKSLALNAPSNLSAVAKSKTEITLNWIDNSISESSFIIERSLSSSSGFVMLTQLAKNSTSYSDAGLASGVTYYYRLRAYQQRRSNYSNYSNTVGVTTLADQSSSGSQQPPSVGSSQRIYGVTVTNPWGAQQLSKITQSLASLPYKPTARIVFDEFVSASEYRTSVSEIKKVSYVMGEILDSYYMPNYSIQDYEARTNEYLKEFGSQVDIWEIGNEINGEWLGDNASVVSKMTKGYEAVKSAGKVTALTLYYNAGCWENPENEMFRWAETNIPQYMKSGLDYVFISFYEDDCNGIKPDWNTEFNKLAQMFPNSKIGFGENGTIYESKKVDYINRYYRDLKVSHPNFVWGNFWWYFDWQENKNVGDMVPVDSIYFSTLKNAILQSLQP